MGDVVKMGLSCRGLFRGIFFNLQGLSTYTSKVLQEGKRALHGDANAVFGSVEVRE